MASLGWTVLERMTSEISRLSAISSLHEEPDRLDRGSYPKRAGNHETTRHTSCYWWPFLSARQGQCWPPKTTNSSFWTVYLEYALLVFSVTLDRLEIEMISPCRVMEAGGYFEWLGR